MTTLKPLNAQAIVVTGATSGIGLATVLAASHAGARVVLAARSRETLDAVVAHLVESGGDAIAVVADVGVREDVERIAEAAIARHGRIDTWVNDAGVTIYGRLDAVSDDDSRRLFDTNFWGVVHGSLVALPHLRRDGGALINLGSEASELVIPLQGMYSASKHAIKGFTDALRAELDADGAPVSVTLIQPTAVDTPIPEHAGVYLDGEPKLPTPMIEPEKVASAILHAATHPTRSTKVGAMSVVDTTVQKISPKLAELAGRLQIGRQQRAEPPHARAGALYEGGSDGIVHGRGNAHAADLRTASESNKRRD